MHRSIHAIVLLIALFAAGCGKKGPLVPPEALRPAPVQDLRVTQRGDDFLVSWSKPGKAEGGGTLKSLAGFELFRRELLPPAQDCEECPTAYRSMVRVDLDYPVGVTAERGRYFWFDRAVPEGVAYRYKLYTSKKDTTTSLASNRADRKKVAPPPAPAITVLSTPTGVELKWQEVEVPAGGRIQGYNVYRKVSGGSYPVYPLNEKLLQEPGFEDRRIDSGARYRYTVRAVALVGGELVESRPSNEAEGFLTPPE
jgi:predicted small lipoprotein YifL